MSRRRLFALLSLLAVGGCLWPVQEKTDHEIALQAAHPFDLGPEQAADTARPAESSPIKPSPFPSKPGTVSMPPMDVQTTALLQPADQPAGAAPTPQKLDVTIPSPVPGSEAPRIQLPKENAAKEAEIRRIYPALPPLPEEPTPLPGPGGRPYTLADLQRIAAENSPTLRQAAADVEAAKGNVIAARAYPNPTFAFEQDPNNSALSPGEFGFYIDQVIKTAGKLKLASAAAMMDLANAELALKRSRSDLSTAVRNSYYSLVVAQETVRVNRALARFTDEIYMLQTELLGAGQAAAYEPASLRAQAYTARLAYRQAIESYVFSWKQLVSVVGLRQLPLSEVAGRVDRLFPAYEYDTALARVLRNHTDVLTARNAIEKARYNLKLQQVTPIPDVDVHVAVTKESTLPPFTWVTGVQFAVPIPVWDQNKGPIISAQAALVRALEEPHRVETNITNNFAAAFVSYKNNIEAVDYYRRYILPDQVRYYRGVYERRRVDPNSAFGDLVQAQQTLAADVSTYLGLLNTLWSSVIVVADFLQTDDLFQQAEPKELPPLPDFSDLPPWPCPHPIEGAVLCGPAAAPQMMSAVAAPPGVIRAPLGAPPPAPAVVAPKPAPAPAAAVPPFTKPVGPPRLPVAMPAVLPVIPASATKPIPSTPQQTGSATPPAAPQPATGSQFKEMRWPDYVDPLLTPPPPVARPGGSS
jgi:cobalt-zinc-cadmium efflux system outer membrane protein